MPPTPIDLSDGVIIVLSGGPFDALNPPEGLVEGDLEVSRLAGWQSPLSPVPAGDALISTATTASPTIPWNFDLPRFGPHGRSAPIPGTTSPTAASSVFLFPELIVSEYREPGL